MNVFIVGLTGGVGGRLAERLRRRGDVVRGPVRREEQMAPLLGQGVDATVGDLASLSSEELASRMSGAHAVVFAAGSNGGTPETTDAIDGAAFARAVEAARCARVERFVAVSVMPESWRERDNGVEVEHYFAVKKAADVALTRSDLSWVILRPALLVDEPGAGTVSLGPAELHGQVSRDDVAETIAELLLEVRISRRILELNEGPTPVAAAVAAVVAADVVTRP